MGDLKSLPKMKPPPPESIPDETQRLHDLYEAVFSIDIVRDRILGEVVRSSKDSDNWRSPLIPVTLNLEAAKCIRQVNRSWMESISIIFRNVEQPLFQLAIPSWKPKDLRQALETRCVFAEEIPRWRCQPPFALLLKETLEIKQDIALLNEIFKFIGETPLVKMFIQEWHSFPWEDTSFPISKLLPSIKFPYLKEIGVLPPYEFSNKYKTRKASKLVQSFIDASPNLEDFSVRSVRLPSSPNWTYPWTLKNLEIGNVVAVPKDDEIRQLSRLTFNIIGERQDQSENALVKILSRSGDSLEELKLNCWLGPHRLEAYDELKIDLRTIGKLSKLKWLDIKCRGWIWNSQEWRFKGEQFPALERLSLSTEYAGLGRLAEGIADSIDSRYPLVRTLDIDLSRPDMGPSLGRAFELLGSTLPALSEMNLELAPEHVSVLGTVFRGMRQLEALNVRFDRRLDRQVSPEELEAAIIGTTPKMLKQIKAESEMMEAFFEEIISRQEKEPTDKHLSSIRDMGCLKSFYISGDNLMFELTDLSFKLGFMMVPSLRILSFGKVPVPQEYADIWRSRGAAFKID